MPLVPNDNSTFPDLLHTSGDAGEYKPQPGDPLVGQAAMQLENSVYAAWQWYSKPRFPVDPSFDVLNATRNSPYWENQRDAFIGVGSKAEWDYVAGQLDQRERAQRVLAAAGAGGQIAAMTAGLLSPTVLLPIATPVRGIQGIIIAAGLGAAGAGIDEAVLQAAQPERDKANMFFALGAGAILGGVMGGAAQLMKELPAESVLRNFKDLRQALENDMAAAKNAEAIPAPHEGSIELKRYGDEVVVRDVAGEVPSPKAWTVARSLETDSSPGGTVYRVLHDANTGETFTAPNKYATAEFEHLQFNNVLEANNWKEIKSKLDLALNTPREKVLVAARDLGYDAVRYEGKQGGELVALPKPDNGIVQEGPLAVPPSASPGVEASVLEDARGSPNSAGASAAQAAAGGAQVARPGSAGGLAPGPGVNILAKINPPARLAVQGELQTVRDTANDLSTGGLRHSENARFVPTSQGGTVHANQQTYDWYVYALTKTMDEHYADYFYNGRTQPPFPATRATLASVFRFTGEHMSKPEFNAAVGEALGNGGLHPVEQVRKAAAILRKEVYDPIFDQAKQVGLIDRDVEIFDPSYFSRMYDGTKIAKDPAGFLSVLRNHFAQQLQEQVNKTTERIQGQRKVLQQYLDDLALEQEQAKALREDLQRELEDLGESDAEVQIKALNREKRQLQRQLRQKEIRGFENRQAAEERVDQAKATIKTLQQGAAATLEKKKRLGARLRTLGRSAWAIEEKRAKVLDRIAATENSALLSLNGVLKRGKRLQLDINKLDAKMLKEKSDKLFNQLLNATNSLDRHMERIAKLKLDNEDELAKVYMDSRVATMERQRARIANLQDRASNIDDLQANRDVMLEILQDLQEEANGMVNQINLARGKRIAKLEERAKKLDPKVVEEWIKKAKDKQTAREIATNERFRQLGLSDYTPEQGTQLIERAAHDMALNTSAKIEKLDGRITGLHMIGEERGPELQRTLQIPQSKLNPYLVTDAERVTRNYIRQMSGDIELKRKFGDVNLKTRFTEIREEYQAKRDQMIKDGASESELLAFKKRYDGYLRTLEALVMRVRHTWGIPDNPNGFAARAGKAMLSLNTLRFMGTVLVSSFSDPAIITMKHGLTRTMAVPFKAFTEDLKNLKLAAREVKLAGAALDPYTHSRALSFAELMDDNVGHSAPERALHTASAKIGQIALFDYWTGAMKQWAGILDIAKLMDSIDLVVNGGGTAKELQEAVTHLANGGFDEHLARRVWDEVQNGGGQKVNGIWLPNTENWVDEEAKRTFRAALAQFNQDAVITPGLEIPLTANSSIGTKMLFQFKSFSLSSTSKVIGAGLQRRDAELFQGMALSLALGALSYYTWATLVGGKPYEDMLNAPLSKWMDEALARSGLTGAFGEIQRVGERIPAVAPFVNFSGQRTTQRAGESLVEAALGPSYDLATTASNVLLGLDSPTRSTLHQLRLLTPLQNIFYLRRIFDLVEGAIAEHLPEKRTNQ